MENHALRRGFFALVGAWLLIAPVRTDFSPVQDRKTTPASLIPSSASSRLPDNLNRLPLGFIPNLGQLDGRVAFYLEGTNQAIFFSREGVTFSFEPTVPANPEIGGGGLAGAERLLPSEPEFGEQINSVSRWTVKVNFPEMNPDAKLQAEEETGTVVSYFRGRPESWKTGLTTYSRLVYSDIWPGIDLVYSGTMETLKSEFIVRPGSDPSHIRLAYRGADSIACDDAGRLVVSTPVGTLTEARPVAYQEISGRRVEIPAAHRIETRDRESDSETASAQDVSLAVVCGFSLGSYDPEKPLIIDPVILTSCGYIGGPDLDYAYGIATDRAGNSYITGFTRSASSFPVNAGPDTTFNGGDSDAFIAKWSASGMGLEFCGYIGGAGNDYGYGIAVDGAGNAYVAGYTSSNEQTFPVLKGPDLTHNGGLDVFVAKLKAATATLEYCGYIGGSGDDFGRGIAVDAAGNAYVTGSTSSPESSFPVAVGPQLTASGKRDVFVAAVAATGTDLIYCGYIGGTGDDFGYGIAVDEDGNAYITGATDSPVNILPAFPAITGPRLEPGGLSDAFAAKISSDGATIIYCGFVGGSSDDFGYGIAVDAEGNAYIAGTTSSSDGSFPVLLGPDTTYNGGPCDAFVARIWKDGSFLVYCGYIGGSEYDAGTGIVIDGYGFAYVTGYTSSAEDTFPVKEGPGLKLSGSFDAFVAKVRRIANALDFCGYIGGADADLGMGIALDRTGSGNIYLAGHTYSTELSFPVAIGPDLTHNGRRDGFVARVYEQAITLVSPNGYELWYAGLEEDIVWLSWGNVGDVMIEYSTDNGKSWGVVVEATENDGRFTWPIPETASKECLIRISEVDDGVPSDTSDATFSISDAAVIFVLSPNGGEAWAVGSEHDIVWRSAKVETVKIEYTYDGSLTWEEITPEAENTGVFRWTIPDTVSDQCRVRVSSLGGTAADVSDGYFSIVEPAAAATENRPEINRTTKQKGAKKSSLGQAGEGGLR